jgi:hypothetical protein
VRARQRFCIPVRSLRVPFRATTVRQYQLMYLFYDLNLPPAHDFPLLLSYAYIVSNYHKLERVNLGWVGRGVLFSGQPKVKDITRVRPNNRSVDGPQLFGSGLCYLLDYHKRSINIARSHHCYNTFATISLTLFHFLPAAKHV